MEASSSVYRSCIRILLREYETGALVTIENPVEAGFGRSWRCWSNPRARKPFPNGSFLFRTMTLTPVCSAPAGPKPPASRVHQVCLKACNFPVIKVIHIYLGSLFGSQVAGSIPPGKRLSIPLICANFSVSGPLLQFLLPPPVVRPPPGRKCCVQKSEHPLAINPGPPGCDVKVFPTADSSVTGEKADTSAMPASAFAMPASASAMATPSNAGSAAKPRSSVHPSQVVGVYHTMEEHLEKALALPCPEDSSLRLPDPLRKNLLLILTKGPVAVSKMRLEALKQVNELAMNLAGDEKALRQSMHPDVEKVTKGKAICLFRSLLEETRFPDMGVIDLLIKGVPLVGEEPPSPLFAKRHKPSLLTPEQLAAQCVFQERSLESLPCPREPG